MFLFGSPDLTHTLCNSRPSMAEKAKLTPQTGERGKKPPKLILVCQWTAARRPLVNKKTTIFGAG